jgi:arabinose-5-phosphate isomerase
VRTKISNIIKQEVEAINNMPIDGISQVAIEMIYKAVHQDNGKIIVSGMGKAGQIGLNIATTFSSTGTPAVFLHPSEAQHGDLGILQKNDILLVVSNSGKTRELIELTELSRRLNPKVKIICLSGKSESELSALSDLTLSTGEPQEVCPLGLTPTTSTTCMTIVGDILVVLMMEKIGFTKEEYAKRHHSGYLGQKAKNENG